MSGVDPLRLTLLVLSAFLIIGFVYTGLGLRHVRRARSLGCYGWASCFVIFVSGSYQRLDEPPIFTTWLTIVPIVLAVAYLADVHSDAYWRTEGKKDQ